MMEALTAEPLPYTGERMVPECSNATQFWNHIYRYRFAVPFVKNRRVLDIACGEGYGTSALALAGASSVIGMDISEEACSHARRKYGIDARVGNAQAIPLADQSVDVVVSFETLEHLDNPEVFLDECLRVLSPRGTLIISTPNCDVYSEHGKLNSFHQHEMDERQFVDSLTSRFTRVSLYTQYLKTAAWWCLGRSLGAELSPWVNLRGFWKLREYLRQAFLPGIFGELSDEVRRFPSQAVFAKESHLLSSINPYSVRPRSHRSQEQPYYFLAVACV